MRVEKLSSIDLTKTVADDIKHMMEEGYRGHPFPRKFDSDKFITKMKILLDSGNACLFILKTGGGEFSGVMAGLVSEDIVSDVKMATEIAWRVNHQGRGFGYLLYDAFEEWSREMKAEKIIMLAMNDNNLGKLKNIYLNRGFKVHGYQFVKEL